MLNNWAVEHFQHIGIGLERQAHELAELPLALLGLDALELLGHTVKCPCAVDGGRYTPRRLTSEPSCSSP